jgi:hypothetical protein
MKAPARVGFPTFLVILSGFLWIGCTPRLALFADTLPSTVPSPAPSAAASGLLDVVLQGPFVIEKTSANMVVLIPQVLDVNHKKPALGDADTKNPRPLNAGNYALTITDPGSGVAKITNPVAGATILRVAGKAEQLASDPAAHRYLRVTLPLPEEIVPWNADPMWVSNVTPIASDAEPVRLAVMVVLRYKYSASTKIVFTGTEDGGAAINYVLQDLGVGQEHVISLVQGMLIPDEVDHPTAFASFDRMKALEPKLSRYIDFPDVGQPVPARNQPLIVNALPKELTDFLASVDSTKQNNTAKKIHGLESQAAVHLLIGHSDCRAAIIFVDYTQ